MKVKILIKGFVFVLFWGISLTQLKAQEIKFSLKYNDDNQLYGVYGKADFKNEQFFVGGGSQLSLILPTDVVDYSLTITSVAGGPWTDNSQVYAPSIDPTHDYHGIATNGSRMNFQPDEEVLLFTFKLPQAVAAGAVRLFDNEKDPHSNQNGMSGADFCNYFACALTMKNFYGGLEEEETVDLSLITSLEPEVKLDFELQQNQPNPFKGETTIGFLLPKASLVQLTFRDVTGRLLKTIAIEGKVGHNAINLKTMDLPKGLMHYQLATPFGSQNKQMLHLE